MRKRTGSTASEFGRAILGGDGVVGGGGGGGVVVVGGGCGCWLSFCCNQLKRGRSVAMRRLASSCDSGSPGGRSFSRMRRLAPAQINNFSSLSSDAAAGTRLAGDYVELFSEF